MKLTDKDFNKQVQKKINDPRTQSKAVNILQEINATKEDDLEAYAIAVMVMETIKALPNLKEYKLVKKQK